VGQRAAFVQYGKRDLWVTFPNLRLMLGRDQIVYCLDARQDAESLPRQAALAVQLIQMCGLIECAGI
jgi:hypothetical protein